MGVGKDKTVRTDKKGSLLLRALTVARLAFVFIPQASFPQGCTMNVRRYVAFAVDCDPVKETEA